MQEEYQQQLLKLIVLTAIPMLLGFAIFNQNFGFQTLAWLQFSLAFLLLPMMVSSCFYKIFSIPTLETMILCTGIMAFHSLLIFGGYANGGIYWVAIFPFLAFFTVGLYKGWNWVLLYFLIGLGIVLLNDFGLITIAYKLDILGVFLSSFFVLYACCSHLCRHTRKTAL